MLLTNSSVVRLQFHYCTFFATLNLWEFQNILVQPRSQGLSSLPPLVVGTETLVAAGNVIIYPSKTTEWMGTQVHLVEMMIKYHPVTPPFQQIFLPPRFWVVT